MSAMLFRVAVRATACFRLSFHVVLAVLLLPAVATAAVPSAPPQPSVQVNWGEVQVHLNPPLDNGGSELTGYTVESQPAGAVDDHAGILTTVHRITGLVEGQTYTFTVRATNADGSSAASPPSAPYRHPKKARVSIQDLDILEGTGGNHTVRVPIRLDPVPESSFELIAATQQYTADQHADFVQQSWASIPISAGQAEAFVDVVIVGDNVREDDESFWVTLRDATRDEFVLERGSATVTLRNDDTVVPMQTRPDRFVTAGGSDQFPLRFYPVANDVFSDDFLWGHRLTVLELPENGQVRIFPGGGGADFSSFEYVPDAGFQGSDRFAYRVCDSAGANCARGDIEVVVRPRLEMDMPMSWRSFGFLVERSELGPRTGVRFDTTPLVPGRSLQYALPANHEPERIWDAPPTARWSLATIAPPADAKPRRVNLLVDARSASGNNVDLYVGIDRNGDGVPQYDELVCAAAVAGHEERCDVELEQGGTQSIRYWTMVQNILTTPVDVQLDVFEVPAIPTDNSLVVTGPGLIADKGLVKIYYGADDPTRLSGEARAGFVQMFDEDGRVGPPSPVRVEGDVLGGVPYLVTPGKPMVLRLAAGQQETGLFFEVPANATRLRVETRSAGEVDLKVLVSTRYEPSDYPTVWTDQKQQRAVSQSAGGNELVELVAPQSGRWFADLHNTGSATAEVELVVTVEGSAPIVRPGSYFNAGRSGSGLFLSPAGGSLAGLWYTFLEDNRPTWYYMEGLKPGPNGIWSSPLYRSAWDGERNVLKVVGRATVTAVGFDRFRFSYQLEGKAGSQVYEGFGRGCPTMGGNQVDISSQWFNPQKPGFGFSAQMWQNYEFYAAFVYDPNGEPRFLVAESPTFAGASATLPLEVTIGTCPTCDSFAPSLNRQPAGTLSREITGGTLARIKVDASYSLWNVPSGWTSDDPVQLLGGSGTAQGCEP